MKLIFHGGANEVGRSCIEIKTGKDRFFLDFGVKFVQEGFKYPQDFLEGGPITGILVTHAHLDHSGGLPLLKHHCLTCPIFMTHQSLALTKLLLHDSYKIAHVRHLHPAYEKLDIKAVSDHTRRVQFDKWYRLRSLKFKFLNAGHIPGSAFILLEAEGKRVLYTGDFNTRTTRLMAPADLEGAFKEGKIDCLITESTYGHRKLPARKLVEKQFLDAVENVVKNGGSALVPVFAVGRAQEILIMLADRKWQCPIYFDGMAKEVTRKVITQQSTYVVNKDVLQQMYFKTVRLVSSHNARKRARDQRPAIFVTTSGMMQGGPAIDYLKAMWHDPRNAVLMTGYQVKGTNGHRLLETGKVPINGWTTPVKCQVRKFDFSGHADIEDIRRFVKRLSPRKIVAVHGDPESIEAMVRWGKNETNATIYGPKVGDTIEL